MKDRFKDGVWARVEAQEFFFLLSKGSSLPQEQDVGGWGGGDRPVAFSPHHLGPSNSEISVSLVNSKLGRPGLFLPLEVGEGYSGWRVPNLVPTVTVPNSSQWAAAPTFSSTNCLPFTFPGNLIHKSELWISGSRPSARELGGGYKRVVV